jgi:N-terminal acetyltransferase B complex non-catalytic subunit
MVRRPTFEEYQKRENWNDGIKRCDDLLKKSPKDSALLIVKLQLLCAAGAAEEKYQAVLDQISTIQPPIQSPADLATIEDAIDTAQQNHFPVPLSAGLTVAKLWDTAVKVPGMTVAGKYDLLSLRFSRAIAENRIADAQQALIQLKVMQPRNRALYMAHAAYTQLLSKDSSDMQARLALMLAKKAVADRFDADDPRLDCRVPGQIFAMQFADADLEGIKDRSRLVDSKQVFEAQARIRAAANIPDTEESDITTITTGVDEKLQLASEPEDAEPPTKESLIAGNTNMKKKFSILAQNDAGVPTLYEFAAKAAKQQHIATATLKQQQHRATADACFLAISSLVKLYSKMQDDTALFRAAFLAERLMIYNDNFHEARLMLIYIYMRLGLGAPAFRLFESLRIKEIQHDTIGHVLFSRLSLTLPYPTKQTLRSTTFAHEDNQPAPDPLERTARALSIYPRHENRLAETELEILSHLQTGMIFDLHALRDHLRRSLTRRITVLEHRRVARISGHAPTLKHASEISPRRVANWTSYLDNRDFDAAFNHGLNVERLLHADGPEHNIPTGRWIQDVLAADCAWSLANDKTPLVVDPERLLDVQPDEALGDKTSGSTNSTNGTAQQLPTLSTTERTVGQISRHDLALLLSLRPSPGQEYPPNTSSTLDALTSSLSQLPLSDDTTTAIASSLPIHFLTLDALKITLATCRSLLSHKIAESEVRNLQSSASSRLAQLKAYVRARVTESKSTSLTNTIRERLLGATDAEDGGLREALELFGEDAVDTFVQNVAADVKEGWEGLEKACALVV